MVLMGEQMESYWSHRILDGLHEKKFFAAITGSMAGIGKNTTYL